MKTTHERAVRARSIYSMSQPAPNEFILGFSAIGERTIREGIKRVARYAQAP
jgi:DNA-binding transcriptional MocR family regulator